MTIAGIGGRPRWQPSEAQRKCVLKLRAEGHCVYTIGKKLKVSMAAIRRECAHELGLPPATPSQTLLQKALAGDVTAIIRWLALNDDNAEERTALFRCAAAYTDVDTCTCDT